MHEDDEWRVSDLLNTDQPLVEDVALAKQILSTYKDLMILNSNDHSALWKRGNDWDIEVRVPRQAIEFMENTLSEWFEVIAGIEERRGNMPYLIDRSLYEDGKIDWNQGLKLSDMEKWMGEYGYIGDYPWIRPVPNSGEPLSGYYNRLLTIKYVLRMMASLTLTSESYDQLSGWDIERDETVTLTDLREKSWKTASYAKGTLLLMDRLLDSRQLKGPKISVGFPNDDEKSRERFVSQFVGSFRKKKFSGALSEMGFANIRSFLGMPTEGVWFTPMGWKFVMMENPVIDQSEGWEKGNRFSDEEVNFLLGHFRKNVPGEWDFIVKMAEMIRGGIIDSGSMNKKLMSSMGWNESKASLYRTGSIARLEELGLLNRIKTGVEVRFELTERGDALLKNQ